MESEEHTFEKFDLEHWVSMGLKVGLTKYSILSFIDKSADYYLRHNPCLDMNKNGNYQQLINYVDKMLMQYYSAIVDEKFNR